MKRIGISLFTRQSPIRISAVAVSCFAVIFLASSCTARVATSIEPIQPQTQGSGAKAPARRIMDPAFANAGKNPGLEIWRIENFKPVAYPQREFGKFYTGDSYIVLNTKKDKNNRFSWDAHFWLGSETSQDEAGAAAILTVQLDDLLNGVPVQHRETQDHESSLFLSYFKNGVRYQDGGVGSGFRQVQTNAAGETRLFQVKGKRNVRVRQVNLSVSSMNKGDCFILDAGNEILVYVGSGAKRVEKLKAISAANQIRDQDHNGRARVNIIDEFSTDMDKQQFFTTLGSGSPNDVPEESTAEDDAAFETAHERSVMLYKVSDSGGSLKVDTVSAKPLTQQMLKSDDCFILDTGSLIYVWVGKKATSQEKTQSMTKAQDFLKTKKYPAWTQVKRIVEGAESAPFKQYFATWRDVGMSHTRLIRAALDIDSDVEDSDIDVTGFDELKNKGGRAMAFMPDSAQSNFSEIMQFVVYEGELKLEEKEIDFSNPRTNYVYSFQYNYENRFGEEGIILYVWEGTEASEDTKEEAWKWVESKAKTLGNCIVVRVCQGHELRHFLKIFKGTFLISTTDAHENTPQMYRITGSDQNDVHGVELDVSASNLVSGDAFAVVYMGGKIFAWIGSGSNQFEKDFAINQITKHYNNESPIIIQEGEESEDFWQALGGEGDYDKSLETTSAPILEPRLFHCKILANGNIKLEEISNYEQSDLDTDDVMLIDGGEEVYIWVGHGTTDEEKETAFKMSSEYLKKEPSHRTSQDVPLVRLYQDSEPKCFKRLFPSWDVDYWKSLPSYEDVLKEVQEANDKIVNQID